MKKLDTETGALIFNNRLPFSKFDSREMSDIILKNKNIMREYKTPSRELYALYAITR